MLKKIIASIVLILVILGTTFTASAASERELTIMETFEEILENGFVGCEKCYEMPSVKKAVDKMFNNKKHKIN